MSESLKVFVACTTCMVLFVFGLWFALASFDVSTWTPAGNNCYAHHYANNHAFSKDVVTNGYYCRSK